MKPERIVRLKYTLSFGAAETTQTQTFSLEGEIRHLHVRCPDFTNGPTVTITINDVDGYAYYSGSAITHNTNDNSTPNVFLAGVGSLTATLSGVPGGAGGDVIIVMHVKKTGI